VAGDRTAVRRRARRLLGGALLSSSVTWTRGFDKQEFG
jgi:hypothetical protein